MPTIDLGNVKGDTGVSMRTKGAWTSSTSYVNNTQYIDVVTYGGSSYACKTSHTSGTSFASDKWNLIAQKGEKGDIGVTPTIKAGTATSLDATAAPTVSAITSGNTTTFNFGIPKGDTSEIKTPTFDDSVGTYSTLGDANTAAESASNAIKSKASIFTILSNMKKSFSAIVQGLKILGTNVGAIRGITSDVAGESEDIAASIKVVNQINSNLIYREKTATGVECAPNTDTTTDITADTISGYILVAWSASVGGANYYQCIPHFSSGAYRCMIYNFSAVVRKPDIMCRYLYMRI